MTGQNIEFKSLGPIGHGGFDLSKDLVVLAGPNNTGKTYAAWAAYGIVRALSSRHAPGDLALEVAERMVRSQAFQLSQDEVMEIIRSVETTVSREFSETIAQYFGADSNQFTHASVAVHATDAYLREAVGRASSLSFSFEVSDSGEANGRYLIASKLDAGAFRVRLLKSNFDEKFNEVVAQIQILARDFSGDIGKEDVSLNPTKSLIRSLALAIEQTSMKVVAVRCVIFPAERSAMSMFAREIAASRVDLVDEILKEPDLQSARTRARRFATPYPRPIIESLRDSLLVEGPRGEVGEFDWLAHEIESTFLDGEVELGDRDVVFRCGTTKETSLRMHLTSSVVKSLAGLVLYLRYSARSGDLLVIDEPEMNLHPDNQRKIARVIARMVNAGLRLLISTHSDFIIRELSHLVSLGEFGDKGRAVAEGLGYSETQLLKAERVGFYRFGSGTIESIPIGREGFGSATIDDEIDAINVVGQAVYRLALGDDLDEV